MRTAGTTEPVRQLGQPASLVIERLFEAQGDRPRTSLVARVFGVSPLTDAERSWYLGAVGERTMARFLQRLPAIWTVVHSMPIGSGTTDIDHIVIGPGGVFTINTKYHRDTSVWVAGGTVKVNGVTVPYVRKAITEARRLQVLLAANGIEPLQIRPIVAFVGAKQLTVRRAPDAVTIIEGYRLTRWLCSRPAVLSPSQVDALSGLTIWPASTADTAEASRFDQLHRLVSRAFLVRRAWGLVGGLAIIGAGVWLLPPLMVSLLPPLFQLLLPH